MSPGAGIGRDGGVPPRRSAAGLEGRGGGRRGRLWGGWGLFLSQLCSWVEFVVKNRAKDPSLDGHKGRKALKPEVKAIDKAMLNSTDPQAKQERDKKLSELFTKHGVSRLTPYKLLFIQGPIFLCFSCAIQNMIEKVPSLKGGGAYWFTDLTTPDEIYILPVLTSMAFAADELRIKAELARSPRLQQIKNWNRVLAVSILPLSMSFCKAHFFYWVPWTLFSLAYRLAFRQPVVRQYLNLPPLAPRPVPATRVPASEEPKPIRAVDSLPAVSVSAQSSSEPRDKSVHVEKRRTPSVITIRVRE